MILLNVGNGTQDSALVNIISLLTSSIRQLLVCFALFSEIFFTMAVIAMRCSGCVESVWNSLPADLPTLA